MLAFCRWLAAEDLVLSDEDEIGGAGVLVAGHGERENFYRHA